MEYIKLKCFSLLNGVPPKLPVNLEMDVIKIVVNK